MGSNRGLGVFGEKCEAMKQRKGIMNDGESFFAFFFAFFFRFSGTFSHSIFSCYIKMEALVMMTMGVFWCVLRCVYAERRWGEIN